MSCRSLRGLLFFFVGVMAWAQASQEVVLTPAQFASELENKQRAVEQLRTSPQGAVTLIGSLPDKWIVGIPGGIIESPTEFLRTAIVEFQKATPQAKTRIVDALSARLAAMREQALLSQAPAKVPADSRQRLTQILSAREFRTVKGPSKLDTWREQIMAWLEAQLKEWGKRFPSSEQAGPIMAWIIISLACSVMAVWIYRRAREVEVEVRREIIPFAPSDKSWRTWLEEARQQASREQWREAVHLAFWAAVSKLEAEGTWRPDRARTPREYLRAIPPTAEVRPLFAAVMRRFEFVWYAGRQASTEDFSLILAELEKMGCR